MCGSLMLLLLAQLLIPSIIPGRKIRSAPENDEDFFDMILNSDRTLTKFRYKGGHLSIYAGPSQTSSRPRYYVTPLSEIDPESAECVRSRLSGKFEVHFNVTMWRVEVLDIAVNELAEIGITARKSSIHPLPILKVRLFMEESELDESYRPKTSWQSNINQQMVRHFTIYAKDQTSCDELVDVIRDTPLDFAGSVHLQLMITKETIARRDITVEGRHIASSKLFAKLNNIDKSPEGDRLLTSSDLNDWAREIASSVIATEITTEDYVDTRDEVNFAQLLEQRLSTGTIDAQELRADQWSSVYWKDDYSRPDRYAKYLNDAATYDEGKNQFSFNNQSESTARQRLFSDVSSQHSSNVGGSAEAQAGFLGIGGGGKVSVNVAGSGSNRNVNDDEKNKSQSESRSLSNMQQWLRKNNLKVEWEGEKWVPKSLNLHRVNTGRLESVATVAVNRIQIKHAPLLLTLDATVGYANDEMPLVTEEENIGITSTTETTARVARRMTNQVIERMLEEILKDYGIGEPVPDPNIPFIDSSDKIYYKFAFVDTTREYATLLTRWDESLQLVNRNNNEYSLPIDSVMSELRECRNVGFSEVSSNKFFYEAEDRMRMTYYHVKCIFIPSMLPSKTFVFVALKGWKFQLRRNMATDYTASQNELTEISSAQLKQLKEYSIDRLYQQIKARLKESLRSNE